MAVKSGLQKPYLYKSKAYKRNDTATIEVGTLELSRLILEEKNIKFEELSYEDQELTFDILCQKLKKCMACGPYFFACDTPSKCHINLRILKEVILRIGGALCRKLTEVKS